MKIDFHTHIFPNAINCFDGSDIAEAHPGGLTSAEIGEMDNTAKRLLGL